MQSGTKFWYTWVAGYRACIIGIPRQNNWFDKIRPNTEDSIQWFAGWDIAIKDSKRSTQ